MRFGPVALSLALLPVAAAAYEEPAPNPAPIALGSCDPFVLANERRVEWVDLGAEPYRSRVGVTAIDLGGCPEVAGLAGPFLERMADDAAFKVEWEGIDSVQVLCRREADDRLFVAVDTVWHGFGNRYGSFAHWIHGFRADADRPGEATALPGQVDAGHWDEGVWFLGFVVDGGRVGGCLTVGGSAGDEREQVLVHALDGGKPVESWLEVSQVVRVETPTSVSYRLLGRRDGRLEVYSVASSPPTMALTRSPEDFGASSDPVTRAPSLATANLALLRWFVGEGSSGGRVVSEAPDYDTVDSQKLQAALAREVEVYETPCRPPLDAELDRWWEEALERQRSPLVCSPWEAVSARPWERMQVEHTGQVFVALAPDDTFALSADGRDWRVVNQPGRGRLAGLAWNGQELLAVGAAGEAWASADGGEWQLRRTQTDADLRAVTWTGNEWVAVGRDGAVTTSRDGRRWKAKRLGAGIELLDVMALGDSVVAVGQRGARGVAAVRTSGRRWQVSTMPQPLHRLAQADGELVAIDADGEQVASRDGVMWHARDAHHMSCLARAAIGQDEHCVDPGGRFNLRHPNGWSTTILAPGYPEYEPVWSDLAVAGDTLVLVGAEVPTQGRIMSATGGSNLHGDRFRWPRAGFLSGIVWTGGRYIAFPVVEGFSATSPDGVTWEWHYAEADTETAHRPLVGVWWRGQVIGFDDRLVPGVSSDGARWKWGEQPVAIGGAARQVVMATGSDRVVAVAGGAIVLTTSDGVVWEAADVPVEYEHFVSATWTGTEFVIVGHGSILRSSDGLRWTAEASGQPCCLESTVSFGSKLIAAGPAGFFLWYPDLGWRLVHAFPTNHYRRWRLAAALGIGVVAVDGDGVILASADGAEWHQINSGGLRPTSEAESARSFVVRGNAIEILAVGEEGIMRTVCRRR